MASCGWRAARSPARTRRWRVCAAPGCACSSPPTIRRRPGSSCRGAWPAAASRPTRPTCSARRTWPLRCTRPAPRRSSSARTGSSRRWPCTASRLCPGPGGRRGRRPRPQLHLRGARPGVRRRAGGCASGGDQRGRHLPHARGLGAGAGSLLAAVVTAGDATPEVAESLTAHGGRHRGPRRKGEVRAVVGDRSSTDGALAAQLGVPFGLVFSGVTPPLTRSSRQGRGEQGRRRRRRWCGRACWRPPPPTCELWSTRLWRRPRGPEAELRSVPTESACSQLALRILLFNGE